MIPRALVDCAKGLFVCSEKEEYGAKIGDGLA